METLHLTSQKTYWIFVLVECIHCDKKVSLRKSSISGVRSHLLYNHPDHYKKVFTQKLPKKSKADVDAVELVEVIKEQDKYEKGRDKLIHTTDTPLKPRTPNQRKMQYPTPSNVKPIQSFLKLKYSTYDSCQLAYDMDCMKSIVKCNLPFPIVDSKGFKGYTYSLNNRVNVKHIRNRYQTNWHPSLVED